MCEHTLRDQPLPLQCLPKLTAAQLLNYKRRLGAGGQGGLLEAKIYCFIYFSSTCIFNVKMV